MPEASSSTRLLVFAKAPRPGEVKTRLVPLLGSEGAAELHAELVERTLSMAAGCAIGPVDLYAAPATDPFLRACAARHGCGVHEQAAGDLGARMLAAFAQALETAPGAILIGTDCPAMTVSHIHDAARALLHDDSVITPTEDGGYALIGLSRRPTTRLFEGIAWSSDQVMHETRQRLRELEYSCTELATLWDIDRPADYQRFIAIDPSFRGNSPGSRGSYIS